MGKYMTLLCDMKTNKQNTPSLKINIILNMLYEILNVFTPLITAPYVSRVLQPEGVGIYSYTNSLLTYFTMAASLGTLSYGKKTIAALRTDKEKYSRAFWEIELITVITTSICLAVWICFSFVYKQYSVYMLVLSFALLATLFDISWLYGGLEKFQYTVSVNLLCKLFSIVCIFCLVKNEDDVILYTFIMAVSLFVGTLSMWIFLPKHIERPHIEFVSMKKHFNQTLVYFGPAVATSIYTVLDKTLIGVITDSSSQNGYYEQATKIINIVKSVCFNAINGVMMARASFFYSSNDKNGLREIKNLSLHLIMLLSVGSCFGLIGISEGFVPLFFGKGYSPVIDLIRILAVVVVVIGIGSVANTLFYTAGGYMKNAFKSILIGSVVNLFLNIVLIPKLYSYGAVVATLIAETIITILFINGTNGFIRWIEIFICLWKKIVAGFVMLFSLMILNQVLSFLDTIFILLIQFFVGGLVYFVILTALKDQSIMLGWKFMKRKKKREEYS